MTESQLKQRKAEAQRWMRAVERAAMSCIACGTDTMQKRQRKADRKIEKAEELTTDYLLSVARVDRKLAESLRALLLPALAEWELELDERVNYPGDLRSKAR